MPLSLTEETYDELHYLLREMMFDESPHQRRIVIASGDDLFNQKGEVLYDSVVCQ
jgi:hypothetical protein